MQYEVYGHRSESCLKYDDNNNITLHYQKKQKKNEQLFNGICFIRMICCLKPFSFKGDGDVRFTTKFIKSDMYRKSSHLQDIALFILYEESEPKFNFLERIVAYFRNTDNMNINVYRYNQV